MSMAKREIDRLDMVRYAIIQIAVLEEAIEYDEDTDDISVLNEDYYGDARRAAYTARKAGEIDASKDEVTKFLDEIVPRPSRRH